MRDRQRWTARTSEADERAAIESGLIQANRIQYVAGEEAASRRHQPDRLGWHRPRVAGNAADADPIPTIAPVSAGDDVRLAGVAFSGALDGWAAGSGHLYSITALSAGNIWAVGGIGHRAPTPLVEHFDGTGWHLIAQPVNTYASFLISVSAVSPSDIWAVGGQTGGASAPVLLEHFDGTAWTEVPNPALPANLVYSGWLRAVTALAHGDIWVVGSAIANSSTSQTLALHFDGTSWQVVPSDNPPAANGVFESVAGTIPGQPLWATSPGPTIETTTG